MINTIDKIIDIGLNTLYNGEPMIIKNQSNSFRFDNDVFYSYQEPIANKVIIDDELFINVYGKTANYGNFMSRTTSSHICKILKELKKSNFWKEKHNIIDINGNIIIENN